MERVCRGADRGREGARSGEACGAEEGGAEAEPCGDGDRGRCVCRGRNSGDGRDEASGLRSTPRINKRAAWPPLYWVGGVSMKAVSTNAWNPGSKGNSRPKADPQNRYSRAH